MRYLLYFTFAIFLGSCGLLNKTPQNKPNNIVINKKISTDTIYVDDSTKVRVEETEEYLDMAPKNPKKNYITQNKVIYRKVYVYKKSEVIEYKEDTSKVVLESYIEETDGDGQVDFSNQKVNRKPSSVEEQIVREKDIIIEDKTTEKQISNPELGIIAYSVPKEMQVGKTYTIKLRISKEKNKIQLIDGDGIPIADANVDSKITIASLRVEPIMSAKLISDSSKMSIQPVSTFIQDIEKEGFTEWEWRLTPIKSGDIFLKIMVNVIIMDSENTKVTKDIPVYNDVVKVKSNVIFSFSGFISEYWQWLTTTIFIPFIVWFYNRKKKKKKN